MSQNRQPRHLTAEQEPFLIARSLATRYSHGYLMESHCHNWHQLLSAATGAMTVLGDRAAWMAPPGRAVLIPAGVRHSIRMWGEVAMRSLYFPPEYPAAALRIRECRVFSITPLLRELILRAIELSALDSRAGAEARLMSVLMDELESAPASPLALPLPSDSRALAAAKRVLNTPDNAWRLKPLARQCGAGARTLERLFRRETGLGFGIWRQKARLLESLRVLAQGESVTNAAFEVGYSSVSAYIAAFKRTFGCTPGVMVGSR